MDAIDGTDTRQREADIPPPSLLVLVLDTNPRAWSLLSSTLPLSRAVATLLVFINAHLAFSHDNRVAVIASHCQRTAWLYPSPAAPQAPASTSATSSPTSKRKQPTETHNATNASKYQPFAQVEDAVLTNLATLLDSTTPSSIAASPTTQISGALTLALSYINKTMLSLSSAGPTSTSNSSAADQPNTQTHVPLTSRVLVVSASGDLAAQYIPLMNAMFGAQHARVAIDILKLAGDSVLLQQASYTTGGVFLSPAVPARKPVAAAASSTTPAGAPLSDADAAAAEESATIQPNPQGLLQYLFAAFLPDATARSLLLPATSPHVDFRAACFCHRRVVDIGYVCSICLSIFCEDLKAELGLAGKDWPDEGIDCLTCGTRLVLRTAEGSVDVAGGGEKKKKKKKDKDKARVRGVDSGVGTPVGDSGAG